MAFQRQAISAETQARLREMAAEVRELLYGEAGCPEWGTKFREIEQTGMSVGLELARLVMEQSVGVQAERMPASALVVEGDETRLAGTTSQPLQTEAGSVEWTEPRAELKRGRKAFFPPPASVGAEGR
jgi:hypothetical protein